MREYLVLVEIDSREAAPVGIATGRALKVTGDHLQRQRFRASRLSNQEDRDSVQHANQRDEQILRKRMVHSNAFLNIHVVTELLLHRIENDFDGTVGAKLLPLLSSHCVGLPVRSTTQVIEQPLAR